MFVFKRLTSSTIFFWQMHKYTDATKKKLHWIQLLSIFFASSFLVNLMFLLLCFDVTYYLNFLVHKIFSLLLMFNKMFFFILKLIVFWIKIILLLYVFFLIWFRLIEQKIQTNIHTLKFIYSKFELKKLS